MQVLYVKWVDSGRHAFEWTEPKDIEVAVPSVETVGFLFKETEDALILVQSKGIGNEPDEVLFSIIIPKVSILEKETIYTPSIG
jgi:hypothetical protein